MDLMAEEGIARHRAVRCRRSGADADGHRGARPTRSTAPGCAARCWATSAWRCTTSCATRWAAASTCRTPRCTRWCCRMRWPTTPARRRGRCSASRGRWAARTRRKALFDLAQRQRRAGRAQGHRHEGRATSTARPTSRRRTSTRIRARWSARRSARCCSAPSTGRPLASPLALVVHALEVLGHEVDEGAHLRRQVLAALDRRG